MIRCRSRVTLLMVLLATCAIARAHVGSPNVFFEGSAGPYPVRIVVRPPGVIPGLADISVRVNTSDVHRVTVLPIRWDTGRGGAPRPDDTKRVRGETNLFSGELWFMRGGAQSVEVEVLGGSGGGKVIVPVNAVATRVMGMPDQLGKILAMLGTLLVLLAVSIAGVAVRESVLPAGESPTRKRLWFSRSTTVLAAIALVLFLRFGKNWWDAEARDYMNNRLYRPVEAQASVSEREGERFLRLGGVTAPRASGPIVPDHGKLMHLFLVRESGNAFAHLHPTKLDWQTFETALPHELPPGGYSVYADVTYETGFADTLIASITLADAARAANPRKPSLDPDDAWTVSDNSAPGALPSSRSDVSSQYSIELQQDGPLMENTDTTLRFTVRNKSGSAARLEPYMGMAGHLILRHNDGSVFTHLHPSGSFSMAAKQLFELRAEGKAPLKVASAKSDPICQLPPMTSAEEKANSTLSFPYAFPKAGRYRLWLQTKIAGQIVTGVFDANVAPAR